MYLPLLPFGWNLQFIRYRTDNLNNPERASVSLSKLMLKSFLQIQVLRRQQYLLPFFNSEFSTILICIMRLSITCISHTITCCDYIPKQRLYHVRSEERRVGKE